MRTEAEEIALAAAGDRLAQSALVSRHMPAVYAVARRMLRDDAGAEDVTQEAFLRAWKALPNWEPKAKFSTWLHRVAMNLCYDRLRKKRESLPGDDLPDQVDTALRPDQALDNAQKGAAIDEAISALPDRQRAAVTLCLIDGETNISAAEILGISVEALESLLSRGRRTLRAQLAELKEKRS
ncbi:MAG: RNA polymerase sigma factor [Pseudomonadota bacterium]